MTADFAAAIGATLTEGRALAESLMSETCTITRAGVGNGPFNTTSGQYDEPARVTVYTGKCRIQIKSVVASSTGSEAGERLVTNQDLELQLPVIGTDTVAIGDVAHIDTAVSDTSLVDRDFTVRARHEKSQATARRLRVTEGTA